MFGNLQDIPPAEAFTLAGRAAGVLTISTLEFGEFTFEVSGGRITGITWRDRSVVDLFELQSVAADLLSARHGNFTFKRCSPWSAAHPLVSVSIAQFVASGLARAADRGATAGVMPSTKTIFVLEREPAVFLGDELQIFYERTRSMLLSGASAEHLARAIHVMPGDAAWHLHRLRLAGVVQPRRQETPAPVQPRRTRRFDTPAIIPVSPAGSARRPAEAQPVSDEIDLRGVRTMRPERSLLRRLTSGLRQMLGRR